MAMTRCPNCHKRAVLVAARPVGETYVPELGRWVLVVERKVDCPKPGGCGTEGMVHVSHRVELYRGESTKRSVSIERPDRRRRRSCGRDEVVELPRPLNRAARK